MKDKFDLLKKADEAYYLGDEPIISDHEYDSLKDYLRNKYPNNEYFNNVGSKPKERLWDIKKHKNLMGSQRKASDLNELKMSFGPFINKPLVVQEKLDGFSLEINYINGKAVSAITRGDGIEGEDVFQNIKNAKGFKKEIPLIGVSDLSVYCEGIMTYKDFNKLKEYYKDENKQPSNPRNSASGIIHREDGQYSDLITLKYYNIIYNDKFSLSTEFERVVLLKKLFKEQFVVNTYKANTYDDIEKIYKGYLEYKRKSLDYQIDGLVIKINDIEVQELYGMKNNRPQGQIALKFPSPTSITQLIEVGWYVSRNGRLNPVANLQPVYLDGSKISKVSLHNLKRIKELDLTYGADVMLKKGGDIIPEIVKKVADNDGKPIIIPDSCPVCGSSLNNDNTFLWCSNFLCPSRKFERIVYYFKVIGVENIGSGFIKTLLDNNIINEIPDFYKITSYELEGLEGIGNKIIRIFFDEIKRTSKMKPEVFLQSLGIQNLSESTAKSLIRYFGSIEKVLEATSDDFRKVEGIGEILSKQLYDDLKKNNDLIVELLKYVSINIQENNGELNGKSFCITGKLEKGTKNDYKKRIEEKGGTYETSVKKDLSFLVCSDKNSTSNKMQKAKKYNINVIDEEKLNELLGE